MNARPQLAEIPSGVRAPDLRPAPQEQRRPQQEVSPPLKESRSVRVQAAAKAVEELEQDLQDLRARNREFNEEIARLNIANEGYKNEMQLAYDRLRQAEAKRDEMVRAANAERDAAVHERVRLETIFEVMKGLMVQANFEIESTRPAKGPDEQ